MDQTPPPGGADDTDPPAPAEPRLLGRATRALAGVAVVAYLAGGVLLALPVRNLPVQDCGTPAAYLYQGRVDVVPDSRDQILDGEEVVTLAPAVADAARATPCQERVAARAAPAGGLLAGATVGGTAAFALELLVVRRRRRALLVGTPAPTVPDGPDLPA